jgi:hypothetical protein
MKPNWLCGVASNGSLTENELCLHACAVQKQTCDLTNGIRALSTESVQRPYGVKARTSKDCNFKYIWVWCSCVSDSMRDLAYVYALQAPAWPSQWQQCTMNGERAVSKVISM